MRARRLPNPMDDCLTLLAYAARFPDKRQTFSSLSKATGVGISKLHKLIAEARADPFHSLIARTACKYRYDYDVYEPRTGKIISAVYRGYVR